MNGGLVLILPTKQQTVHQSGATPSTRKVEELVKSLGLEGISKSEVSRICKELDDVLEGFRSRPLTSEYPYVWLDAKVVKVRQDGRVVPMAAVVAIGVRATGEREVLGFDVGAAESYALWLEFLRSLVARGLKGVRLVISDAHGGLKRALSEVLAGGDVPGRGVKVVAT